MFQRIMLALVGSVILGLFVSPVKADTFVWKDPVHDFTISFPDSWRVQTEDTPDTRLRIAGPLGEDYATCRVKAARDGRLQIYAKKDLDEAVSETLNEDFWKGEVAQYENAVVTDFHAPASLGGQGDATAIRTSFVMEGGAGKMTMLGTMIGSIYGDTRYIVSCSSKADVYGRWAPVFASIMGSVELDTKYHPFATGYYRDFLADVPLVLSRIKPGTTQRNTLSILRYELK